MPHLLLATPLCRTLGSSPGSLPLCSGSSLATDQPLLVVEKLLRLTHTAMYMLLRLTHTAMYTAMYTHTAMYMYHSALLVSKACLSGAWWPARHTNPSRSRRSRRSGRSHGSRRSRQSRRPAAAVGAAAAG
jgi:hypothetical protein